MHRARAGQAENEVEYLTREHQTLQEKAAQPWVAARVPMTDLPGEPRSWRKRSRHGA